MTCGERSRDFACSRAGRQLDPPNILSDNALEHGAGGDTGRDVRSKFEWRRSSSSSSEVSRVRPVAIKQTMRLMGTGEYWIDKAQNVGAIKRAARTIAVNGRTWVGMPGTPQDIQDLDALPLEPTDGSIAHCPARRACGLSCAVRDRRPAIRIVRRLDSNPLVRGSRPRSDTLVDAVEH
jgi:hypothetical protein